MGKNPNPRPKRRGSSRCQISGPQERVKQELIEQGYSSIAAQDYSLSTEVQQALADFLCEGKELPVDIWAKNGERRRRYGLYAYLPYADDLRFNPTVNTYTQPYSLNRDAAGTSRYFELLTPAMASNLFLQALIRHDFHSLPLSEGDLKLSYEIGVHVVQMVARPGLPGISSPDSPHRDGEPWTFIHLLDRSPWLSGGFNRVFDGNKKLLAETILSNTLDSQVVKDDAVFHQVTRVEVPEGIQEGTRTVLLIDVTPLYPHKKDYQDEG